MIMYAKSLSSGSKCELLFSFLTECASIWHNDCLWCVIRTKAKGYDHGVKGQGQISNLRKICQTDCNMNSSSFGLKVFILAQCLCCVDYNIGFCLLI